MEKKHLDRRLDQMRREGTVFRAGVSVGDDADRGPCCATATTPSSSPWAPPRPATCRSPAASWAGIHQAMEFLPQSNRASLGEEVADQITPTGKDVVIIGGGDTGADCLGTATRQGAALDHAAGDHAGAAGRTGPPASRGRRTR